MTIYEDGQSELEIIECCYKEIKGNDCRNDKLYKFNQLILWMNERNNLSRCQMLKILFKIIIDAVEVNLMKEYNWKIPWEIG